MAEDRERLSGRTKQTAGKLTGDERLESEGKSQRDTAEGKRKAKAAGDKFKGAVEGVKDAFKKDKR